MKVAIITEAERRGPSWTAQHPQRADHLVVRVTGNGRREYLAIGPPTAGNVERAEKIAAEHLEAFDASRLASSRVLGQTFGALAENYLEKGMKLERLAPSTQEDRTYHLTEDGPILHDLGGLRPERIEVQTILDWWQQHIVDSDRSVKTGRNYLDSIAAVFRYAIVCGEIQHNPVDVARSTLRALNRSKAGRADRAPSKANPIEADDLGAFVAFSSAWRTLGRPPREMSKREAILIGDVHLANLLQLDAGLRLGEAFELRWESVHFGIDADDTSRRFEIVEARARGKFSGTPKSGRRRVVAMSRRLRTILLERRMELGRPEPRDRVLVRSDPKPYRTRHFRAICAKAGIGHRTPKDLRDSFGSHLLSMGVSLGWISQQLGHANAHVTAHHYARQLDAAEYRQPLQVGPGEVPADLLTLHVSPTSQSVSRLEAALADTRNT